MQKYSDTRFMHQLLKEAVRDVEDFPKEGIIFKDISPILQDHKLFQKACDAISQTVDGQEIDKVVGIDARGFIFGAPIALALNAGFVPIRKKGKLPWQTYTKEYALEYGTDTVEVHQDAIQPGEKVLLVDDLLATGGTAAAAVKLINDLGADLVCVSFLIELSFLNGREKITCDNIHSILNY